MSISNPSTQCNSVYSDASSFFTEDLKSYFQDPVLPQFAVISYTKQ